MNAPTQPRHAASRSRVLSVALPIGLAVTAIGVLWALGDTPAVEAPVLPPMPVAVMQVPAVDLAGTIADDPCADPAVQSALAAGDDAAAIAGFGGGENFRAAIVAGNAPCVSLSDPARIWVVVNKTRPLTPADYVPQTLTDLPLEVTTSARKARADVATAAGELAQVVNAVGRIGANNGYRSYGTQVATYNSHVRKNGQTEADAGSARPGHSEHQTGLAVDVVACNGRCGSIGAFAGSAQDAWMAAHAWEHGFIVRYEAVGTTVTGYLPEPWHLRYVGVDLAAAYHQGGFHTLEEFFGLPAAPDYSH